MRDMRSYKLKLEDLHDEFSDRITALSKDINHKEQAVEKDFAEQATQAENDDVLNALNAEAKSMLIQIDKALIRIEEDNYGLCEACGKQINEARLQALPHVGLCIECAEKE